MGLSFMHAQDMLPGPEGSVYAGLHVPAAAIPACAMRLLSRYRLPEHWRPRTNLGLALCARSFSFAVPPSPAPPGIQIELQPSPGNIPLEPRRSFGLAATYKSSGMGP